ncbi:MAG TPA: DUF2630 family protein [Candidatus Polarisedimenticolia bacterium]|jgi:hypothetical protein|nr:DUF2630 family protein [Candidatus Polarisedimenticolia bacterium]
MDDDTTDQRVRKHIAALVDEEHRLFAQGNRTSEDQRRLQEIQVELNQCWNLLRQRRALREFTQDPDRARLRPGEVLEDYEQ